MSAGVDLRAYWSAVNADRRTADEYLEAARQAALAVGSVSLRSIGWLAAGVQDLPDAPEPREALAAVCRNAQLTQAVEAEVLGLLVELLEPADLVALAGPLWARLATEDRLAAEALAGRVDAPELRALMCFLGALDATTGEVAAELRALEGAALPELAARRLALTRLILDWRRARRAESRRGRRAAALEPLHQVVADALEAPASRRRAAVATLMARVRTARVQDLREAFAGEAGRHAAELIAWLDQRYRVCERGEPPMDWVDGELGRLLIRLVGSETSERSALIRLYAFVRASGAAVERVDRGLAALDEQGAALRAAVAAEGGLAILGMAARWTP